MSDNKKFVAEVTARLGAEIQKSITQCINQVIEKELDRVLNEVLASSDFHKQLSEEMHHNLKGLYQELYAVSADDKASAANAMFSESTRHLDEAMQTMRNAAEEIMQLSETLMAQQEEAGAIIACLEVPKAQEGKLATLDKINKNFEDSLTKIMTSLSFHDLTGQRLQKVTKTLTDIQNAVFEMYMSSGLILKGHTQAPTKDLQTIKKESQSKIKEIKKSELKGPSLDTSQKDVDDLLASLGM